MQQNQSENPQQKETQEKVKSELEMLFAKRNSSQTKGKPTEEGGQRQVQVFQQPVTNNTQSVNTGVAVTRGQPSQTMSQHQTAINVTGSQTVDSSIKKPRELLQPSQNQQKQSSAIKIQKCTELQKAFQALKKDQNNLVQSKDLETNFQNKFLQGNGNKILIENLQNAISGFCEKPQNQDYIKILEKCLTELYAKIRWELEEKGKDETKLGGDGLILASYPIMEIVLSDLKNLNIQHIQSMCLFLRNLERKNYPECPPREMMPALLHQIRLIFPLSCEEKKAYDQLLEIIGAINEKKEFDLSDLLYEVRDYFENRLFYDQKKTHDLIMHLRYAKISVPKCLYVNEFSLGALTKFSNKFLVKEIFNKSELHMIDELTKNILKKTIEGNLNPNIQIDDSDKKISYMLNPAYINSSVNIEIDRGYCVVTLSLLVIIELDKDNSVKNLFPIPGYIHTVFEMADSSFQLKVITASNNALLKLVTEEMKECNDAILKSMVAQAKKEESPEWLNEWYIAQSRIFFAKEFSQKYKNIFDYEAFQKKFKEEAGEFLDLFKKSETIWDKLEQVGSGFGKLFLEDEDKKITEVVQTENYTEQNKFIRIFYSVICGNGYNSNFEDIKIPLPLPTIKLGNNDGLCIAISHQAKEFIGIFKKHDANLKFIDFEDRDGNIRAVFGVAGLKEFLVAWGVPKNAADEMVDNLYKALHEKKYKYVLSLEVLEKSSNIAIAALKNHEWMHIAVNNEGKKFAEDIRNGTQVNYRQLSSGKNDELITDAIKGYAKKFPLVNQYKFAHSQSCGHLFIGATEENLDKGKSETGGKFIVAEKNSSINIEFTETSATCVTNNNLLIIFDTFNKKSNASFFSIPGHVQTTYEMVGKYQLQTVCSQSREAIPSGIILQQNPQKLYLYLNKQGLLEFAVYDTERKEVIKKTISDNELRQKNADHIKNKLNKHVGNQEFNSLESRAALSPVLELAEIAGYPILGLKLKSITTSNSALKDLVFENFEKCNEETLAELVARAKKEESKESLYEWYKTQAVVFYKDNFRKTHNKALNIDDIERAFYAEVQQFLSARYTNPGDKFYQFIDEVHELLKADEDLLKESASLKDLSKTIRQLPVIPQSSQVQNVPSIEALQNYFNLFIKDQENIECKKNYQSSFLNINKVLVEKVGKAIVDFIATPQKQFCGYYLEKCLFELILKLNIDLKSDKPWDTETLYPAVRPILEKMVSQIKGLEVQHIQSLNLLLDNWNKEWGSEDIIRRLTYPKKVLDILLNQVRLRFPLSQEQNRVYNELMTKIKERNNDKKLNSLNMEVDDYFNNRLFSDQEKTQGLSERLKNAGIAVPECFFTLSTTIIKPLILPQRSDQKPNTNTNSTTTISSTISQQAPVHVYPVIASTPTQPRALPQPSNPKPNTNTNSTTISSTISQQAPVHVSPVITSTPTNQSSSPQSLHSKPNTNTNSTISSNSQQNPPVSPEFRNKLSQIITTLPVSQVGNGQQNYESNQSGAKLVNAIRNQPGNQQVTACVSEIDKFRDVIAKEFVVKTEDIKDILVKLIADDNSIRIYIPNIGIQEYKNIDELKEHFKKSGGIDQVSMKKLHQELSDDFKKNDYGQDKDSDDENCTIS